MKHRISTWTFLLILVVLVVAIPACREQEDPPLPEVEGVAVALGPESLENPGEIDTVIVSWSASRDSRVQGYAIYRAEQGTGATTTEKSEFILQAITIATQYVDDEVRTSLRYPTMRYFYQVAVIGPETMQGPMSPEVSIEYTGTNQAAG
jgi:hypothetical protein